MRLFGGFFVGFFFYRHFLGSMFNMLHSKQKRVEFVAERRLSVIINIYTE